ncbi:MAG: hypothetical protein AB1489_30615 [Acidobacteriota bacterium]
MLKTISRKVLSIVLLVAFCLSLPQLTQATFQVSDKQLELAGETFDYTGYYYTRFIVEKLMKLNLSASCWDKALGKDGWGAHQMSFVTRDVESWFKEYLGYTQLSDIEGSGAPVQKENRPRVEKAVDEYKQKYFLTVDATDCECNTTTANLVRNYTGYVASFPYRQRFVPKSGVYYARLIVTPKVKDVTASVSKDGKEFTVTAPAEIEPAEWDSKIYKVFSRASKDY